MKGKNSISKINLNDSKKEGAIKRSYDESFRSNHMMMEDEGNNSISRCDESNDKIEVMERRIRAHTQGTEFQLKLPNFVAASNNDEEEFKVEESCGTYRVVEPEIQGHKRKLEVCTGEGKCGITIRAMDRQCKQSAQLCIYGAEAVDSYRPPNDIGDVCENDGFYPLLFAF